MLRSGSSTLYDENLIQAVPTDISGFSLGCGDPITLAKLQPGETVLDLGSGGGLDCFLAAKQVGETGTRHRRGYDARYAGQSPRECGTLEGARTSSSAKVIWKRCPSKITASTW